MQYALDSNLLMLILKPDFSIRLIYFPYSIFDNYKYYRNPLPEKNLPGKKRQGLISDKKHKGNTLIAGKFLLLPAFIKQNTKKALDTVYHLQGLLSFNRFYYLIAKNIKNFKFPKARLAVSFEAKGEPVFFGIIV